MRALLMLWMLLWALTAQAQDPAPPPLPPPEIDDPPAVPAVPEPALPPKVEAPGGPPPEVTIRTDAGSGDVIEEYRQNGVVYMVRVQPQRGPPYLLLDTNGDGRLDTRDGEGPVRPVYWTLYTWQ